MTIFHYLGNFNNFLRHFKLKIAVFVSGRGSNLQAILESQLTKESIEVIAVISNKKQCAAFEIAELNSIPTFTVGNEPESKSYSQLVSILTELKVELIVLAGYLKLIPLDFIKNFKEKIINIHPALLPLYGGKGMYGMNIHKAVFNSGDKFSGPTIHFVNERYDSGTIIAQEKIDISEAKSPEDISDMVLKKEHELLPFVIYKFAKGKVIVENNRVKIL